MLEIIKGPIGEKYYVLRSNLVGIGSSEKVGRDAFWRRQGFVETKIKNQKNQIIKIGCLSACLSVANTFLRNNYTN